MPPAATPPRARTRPVVSGTSRTILRGRFQPTRRGYHRIPPRKNHPSASAGTPPWRGLNKPPRPLTRAPLLEKGGDRKEKGGPFLVVGAASEHQTPRFFLVLRLLPYFLWRSLRMAASCAASDASSASTVEIGRAHV